LDKKVKASEILRLYHKNVWPAVFIIILLFGFFSIFITHKIAGPVYRLKTRLQQIIEGDLASTVTLRKDDDFQELADSVNLLSAGLKGFATALKGNLETLSCNIDEIQQQIEAGRLDIASGRALIARLDASREKISATLDSFKIQR